MALVNINEGLKEEYSMNKIFSAEYDFSCVRQIARADRFACVLTRALARVKRKGLYKQKTKLASFFVLLTAIQ